MKARRRIEIEGLIFHDYVGSFGRAIGKAVAKRKISDERQLAKLKKKLPKLIDAYRQATASVYLENHNLKISTFLKTSFTNQRRIVRENREAFTYLILYLNGCFNIYGKIAKAVERKRLRRTLKLCLFLYGLVIRRAQQIVDLLINGNVDGAMIVWRSLYENAVVLLFLASEDDDELSKRFFEHSTKNSSRKVATYSEHYKDLGFRPLPKRTHTNLAKNKNRVSLAYGKDFLKNEYGWADKVVGGRVTFKDLEDKVGLSRFRTYYLLCSEQIHSNFGSFNRFMHKNKLIVPRLLGQDFESQSFIDPMQFTVSILDEVNDYILWEFSARPEHEANALLFTKIFEKLQKSYRYPTNRKRK